VITFFFAYAMTRTTISGKPFFQECDHAAALAPSIIEALALIYLFGRNGLITAHLLKINWNIYGATGLLFQKCCIVCRTRS